MIVIIGDSASGKSAIERNLVKNHGFQNTISYTTREPRDNEIDGIDYHFITKTAFLFLKQDGFFAETTLYNGNYYGTAKQDCTNDKIAVVNPQGLRALRNCKDIFVTSFYIRVPRRDRLIKALTRGDDIDRSYQRSLSDIGEFTGVADEVDFIIDNPGYKHTVEELTEQILSKLK